MRLILMLTSTVISPLGASADVSWSAELAAHSTAIDRGEQLGRTGFDSALTAEVPVGDGAVFASVYRLTPVGAGQDAFDDEVDYTLGYARELGGMAIGVSANLLTYPGEETDNSLEFAGEIALDAPFSPSLVGFYDADLEDWGLEAAAGPEVSVGAWTVYGLVRAGVVEPGDGSATRSYAGLETGAGHPIGENTEFGVYARIEVADEAAFVASIRNDEAVRFRDSGAAFGLVLASDF